MDKPIASPIALLFRHKIIIALGFLFFASLTIWFWIIIYREPEADGPNIIMTALFSCIPIGIFYVYLSAKESFFYSDYFIQKSKLSSTKYYYHQLSSYGQFAEYKNGKQEIETKAIRIVIESRNHDMVLKVNDADALLNHLNEVVPDKKNNNIIADRTYSFLLSFKKYSLYWFWAWLLFGAIMAINQSKIEPMLVSFVWGIFSLLFIEFNIWKFKKSEMKKSGG